MTKRQYKICSEIDRTKNVQAVLKKFNIPDTWELQNELGTYWVNFDNSFKKVWLEIAGQQAFEDYKRGLASDRKATLALIVAALALLQSAIAIVMQYLLPV